MESRMARAETAFTMKPREGIASRSPSSSSRTSAIRTGVRDTPVVSTACSSEIRSPGRNAPDRIWSRSASCARTVCETERSASRSAIFVSPRLPSGLQLRRRFSGDHAINHPPRPHRAGIDVEVVEYAIGVLVHRALLRFKDELVFAKNVGNAVANFRGQALLTDAIVSHEGPEIMAGLFRLRRDGVEHKAVD